MYQLVVKSDEDTIELKKLLTVGPNKYSCCSYTFQCMSDAALFGFHSREDLEMIEQAAKQLGLTVTKQIDEDLNNGPSELGKAVAGALSNSTKKPGQRKPVVPIKTPQEKAEDQMATDIDDAVKNNPMLQRNLEKSLKGMGVKMERLDPVLRGVINTYIAEGSSWKDAIYLTKTFWSSYNDFEQVLIESVVDDLTTQMMEYFITLKAQGVKDIPLSKLVKAVDDSTIDLNPSQDMEFFVNLLSSLPGIENVDPSRDIVELEMPSKPDSVKGDPEDPKARQQNIDDIATAQAKKGVKANTQAPTGAIDSLGGPDLKGGSGNLFASRNYPGQLIESYVDGTGEVAEALTDLLDSIAWDGKDQAILQREAKIMARRYPSCDPAELARLADGMFKQFYGDTK